jgi:hypothetical protein
VRHKIYLAGPMRGIKDFNFPAFHNASKKLRNEGHEVFNPAEVDEAMYGEGFNKSETGDLKDVPKFDLKKALFSDVTYILNRATHIALLPNWETSKGAQMELALSNLIGLEVIYLK